MNGSRHMPPCAIARSRGLGMWRHALTRRSAALHAGLYSVRPLRGLGASLPFDVTRHGSGTFLLVDLQDGEEGFLGDLDFADALHALLALFLLFEELALAGDVAAVALGED